VLRPKSLALFRIGFQNDDRFAGDVGEQHEDLVVNLVHIPVGPERVLQIRARQLLRSRPSVLLQCFAIHPLPFRGLH
jgi:hypothetical protein